MSSVVQSVDAAGHLVMPGGIEVHMRFAQPTSDGTVMAADFESGMAERARELRQRRRC